MAFLANFDKNFKDMYFEEYLQNRCFCTTKVFLLSIPTSTNLDIKFNLSKMIVDYENVPVRSRAYRMLKLFAPTIRINMVLIFAKH